MKNPLFGPYDIQSYEDFVDDLCITRDGCRIAEHLPVIGYEIAYGLLPLLVSLVLMIMTPSIWGCVLCCNKFLKVQREQKVLDKERKEMMQELNIKVDKKATRASQLELLVQKVPDVAQNPKLFNHIAAQNGVNERKQAARKSQKCKVTYIVLWYISCIPLLLAVIYFGLSSVDVVKIPKTAFNTAVDLESQYRKVADDALVISDDILSQLLDEKVTPLHDLMYSSAAEFNASLSTLQNAMTELELVKEPLEKVFSLVQGKDSVLQAVGSVLYFPEDPKDELTYVKPGQQKFDTIIAEMKELDENVNSVQLNSKEVKDSYDQNLYPPVIQTQLDGINLAGLNVDLYKDLPAQVTDLIKLFASNPNKWQFANKAFQIAADMIADLDTKKLIQGVQRLLVPCDANGQNCAINYLQEVVFNLTKYNMKQILGMDFTYDNVLLYVQQQVPKLIDEVRSWKGVVDEHKIIPSLDHLETITIEQLFHEMSATCDYMWCDILDGNYYSYQTAFSAIVYACILTVPILILVISITVMACNKKGCISCQAWSCCFCSVCVSLMSVILILMTAAVPMFVKPLTTSLGDNTTSVIDITLKQVDYFYELKQVSLNLTDVASYVKFQPQALTLDLTSVQRAIDTFKFNVTFDLNAMLHEVFGAQQGPVDFAQMLDDIFGKYVSKTYAVSFAGTNLDYFFNEHQKLTIGQMLHFQDKPLYEFIQTAVQSAVDLARDFDNGVQFETMPAYIRKIVQTEVDKLWQDNIVPQLDKLQAIKAISLPVADICNMKTFVEDVDQKVTNPLTSFILMDAALNETNINNFAFPAPVAVPKKLDSVSTLVISEYLEFLAVNNKLSAYLASCLEGKPSLNLEADTSACIDKLLLTAQKSLDVVASKSQEVVGSFASLKFNSANDFKQQMIDMTCATQQKVEDVKKYVSDVAAGTAVYDPTQLPAIASDEVLAMQNRQVTSFVGFTVSKPDASSPTLNQELSTYALNFAKLAVYCQSMQQISGSNPFETAPVTFQQEAQHMAVTEKLMTQFSAVIASIDYFNVKVMGNAPFVCSASQQQTGIVDLLPTQLKAAADVVVENAAQAFGTNPVFCPFVNAFKANGAVQESAKLAQLVIDQSLRLFVVPDSLFTSETFGLVLKTVNDVSEVIVEPLNGFSFGFYCMFFFCALGPLFLVCGYGFVAQVADKDGAGKKGYTNIENQVITVYAPYTENDTKVQQHAPVFQITSLPIPANIKTSAEAYPPQFGSV
ncbi:Conserved_hypothetical protein [Hexamita inflata]|uniref:Uncharacterized protein n=1 Tax=Hexamita inflata TaxID=28002 RepID=A0AA86UI99_9EUKA|nr:Conserved hypothetical protein [Hexamita inflata]